MMKIVKLALAVAVVAASLAVVTGTASATGNNRPICRGPSFNMPGQGESVVINVLSPTLVADPDGDPLQIVNVFGGRFGFPEVGDNGTPNDTTDDVLIYTRTEPLIGGYFSDWEVVYYSVSDGELSSQCSAHFFPSNIW